MLGTAWVRSDTNGKGKGSVLGHKEAYKWMRVVATDNFLSLWATEIRLVGRKFARSEYTEIKWRSRRQDWASSLELGREIG